MRIAVVSDTHGYLERATSVLKAIRNIDLLLHAGDHYRDAFTLAQAFSAPVKGVVGNCDRGAFGPEEEFFEIAGHKIFLTHGHFYGVKRECNRLVYQAQKLGADLVVFGHTHQATCFSVGETRFLNPGTAGLAGPRGELTGAIIEVGSKIEICIVRVPVT